MVEEREPDWARRPAVHEVSRLDRSGASHGVPLGHGPVDSGVSQHWPDEAPDDWSAAWPDELPQGSLSRAMSVLRFRAGRYLIASAALIVIYIAVISALLASSFTARLNAPAEVHTPVAATATSSASPVITLLSPDAINRAQQATAGSQPAPLPTTVTSAPSQLLPPDKPSPYEMSLIAALGTPDKAIVVSRDSQTMHVYQDGAYVAGTYVITGRPDLPTPTGVFHIYYKLAPATLYSPWSPGSPYWYPPTPVNYTMEFKDGGFLIHDAPWHHVWGPGMNGWHFDPIAQEWQWGSHGCVTAPTPFVKWLYDWSPEGTTVIIY